METDLLEMYRDASKWTNDKVVGAADQLDATTPCDDWDVRTLLDHMLDTQKYFAASARGEEASMPSPTPPALLSDDPVADFERARNDTIEAFSAPGALEKTGPALGFAFTDQLLHGWDLAQATGQDTEMPDGLADAAFDMINGRLTDDQRNGMFKPAVDVGSDASVQDRFLAYAGRNPG